MGHWLQRNIVEPGKLPLLLALTAFVLTFVITRVITRLIRAGKGPFGNISSGGVHIHHVVPGVVLTVTGGFGAVASGRHGFGSLVFAVIFGIGTGLVFLPFGVNDMSDEELQDRGGVLATVGFNLLFSLAVLFKGKAKMAVFSVFIPFIGLIGLVRLARPGSLWARRFYRRRPHARAKAALRAYHHDRRWARPRRVLADWLGGKTNEELTESAERR